MARSVSGPGSHRRENQKPQIFVKKDGGVVYFWFHPALSPRHVQVLSEKIREHGGTVTDDEKEADMIITDEKHWPTYELKYSQLPKPWVKTTGFIGECIELGRYDPKFPRKQGMGGIPGGRRNGTRTEFTKEDEEHLCDFLARVVPDKESGGRTGNKIYIDLCKRAEATLRSHNG
ncbi:hypothetical protein K474DRAFT_1511113 [Panus rudis PR-1116 ss-1]|nr:hypothetical protein K474DRAFT_1511113 [Panus rudis PR-1116 ss-1]